MLKKLSQTTVIAVLLSLLIHSLFGSGLYLVKNQSPESPIETIEFVVITDKAAEKNLKQIVDQDKSQLNDEIPEDTKFLGRHNQRVVRQTRAAKSGAFTNAAKSGGKNNQGKKSGKKSTANNRPQTGSIPTLTELKPKFNFADQSLQEHTQSGSGPESQTSDYLKDIEKSNQTLLSTREFVYFSYYQRIRDKIRQYWEPSIREKVRKIFASGRTIASSKDRITKVIIVLDQKGALLKVQIIGKSGIVDLDDAAVEAFRAAEPFPNPPDGIVEPDGTIKIRWDFVLEANISEIETFKIAEWIHEGSTTSW